MLTSVPETIRRHARMVTLNHPNSFGAVIWRKEVKRVELGPNGQPSEMGGAPTMGGLGVLRSEDEAEIDYVERGPAKVVFCGVYQPTSENDQGSAQLLANMQEALIECTLDPSDALWFECGQGDLVFIDMGFGVILAHSIEDVMSTVNVPPYTRKFVLQPRDDLGNLEPFLPD
jgi:hypothetical protein